MLVLPSVPPPLLHDENKFVECQIYFFSNCRIIEKYLFLIIALFASFLGMTNDRRRGRK